MARGGVCHSGVLQETQRCREHLLPVPSQKAVRVPTDIRKPLRRPLRGEIFRTFGVCYYTRFLNRYCMVNERICGTTLDGNIKAVLVTNLKATLPFLTVQQ